MVAKLLASSMVASDLISELDKEKREGWQKIMKDTCQYFLSLAEKERKSVIQQAVRNCSDQGCWALNLSHGL